MAREFPVDVLEDMLEKFRVVTKERRDEEEQLQRQRAEQQEKLIQLLALMKADGIEPEELLSMTTVTSRAVKNVSRARQNIVLPISNGEVKTRTGQGRTPKPIAQALVRW